LNWVVRNGEGHVVGYVQATVAAPDAWVAYVLGRPYWGHGYATAATRLMMQHLGAMLGVRRFLATVDRRNARSLAVLGRLGFVPAVDSAARSVDCRAHERLFVAAFSA
jgi:RimJ/RimL family protein N-acetyltransferase